MTLKEYIEEKEREFILQVIQDCKGKVSLAYKQLGIERATFYSKIHKYKINPNEFRNRPVYRVKLNRLKGGIKNIVRSIYRELELPRNDKSKQRAYTVPRFTIMYVLYHDYKATFEDVAAAFGLHHSTALCGVRQIELWIKQDLYDCTALYDRVKYSAESYQKKLSNN